LFKKKASFTKQRRITCVHFHRLMENGRRVLKVKNAIILQIPAERKSVGIDTTLSASLKNLFFLHPISP